MSERDDFEAWGKTVWDAGMFGRSTALGTAGQYFSDEIEFGWQCWQARGALEAVPYEAHHKTLGEARVEKTQNGKDWTPRDLLARMLRDFDSGKISPQHMIVVFRDTSADGPDAPPSTFFVRAGPDNILAVGLLATAQSMILNG